MVKSKSKKSETKKMIREIRQIVDTCESAENYSFVKFVHSFLTIAVKRYQPFD